MKVATLTAQKIAMKHGAGGRSMRRLIEQVFLARRHGSGRRDGRRRGDSDRRPVR